MHTDKPKDARGLWGYVALTFGVSWLIWATPVMASLGWIESPVPNLVLAIVGAHGPLVAALVMTGRESGWAGVKRLVRAGFDVRMTLVWWIVIVFAPVLLSGLAVWANGMTSEFVLDTTLLRQPLMILPTFVAMFVVGGSVQEEFGWRGYALPRLLAVWNPLLASVILGLVWGLWHWPLFFVDGASQSFMPFGVFVLLAVGFSVLFTLAYLRTERNLFSALLLHTVINTSLSLFPPIEQRAGGNQMALTYLALAYVVVAVVLVLREPGWWLRGPGGARA
jgi:membrane protease YdiL (CAAX protease family)